jgi:hypothetical protein
MAGVPRVRMSSLLALGMTTALVLGGCGSDDEAGAPAARPAGRATPGTTTTTPGSGSTPTASPRDPVTSDPVTSDPVTSDPVTGDPTSRPARRPGGHKTGMLRPRARGAADEEHLLPADRMPTLGDTLVWSVGSTAPEDPDGGAPVGACQKTALGAIGAVASVRRTFEAAGGFEATQVVARFADPRSAWRAHEVLASWREDCADRLADARAEVGPLQTVRVHAGTGAAYLAAYDGRADRAGARSAGLGILRAGSYLTLVEVTAGPGGYPEGRNPARVAVRRVSRTF